MTNFIFKSQETYKKLANKLEMIQHEQRSARADLSEIKFMLHKLLTDKDLENQVDKYFERDDQTSHQTDLDEQE